MNIAIIGRGNVGSSLQRGLQRAGHEVEAVGNEPERVRKAASRAELIILAVPFRAVDDTLRAIGDEADGKIFVDTTNVHGPDRRLTIGFTTSGGEELQKKLPAARVVKAFNAIFAEHMDTGVLKGEQLTALFAADDDEAKRIVMDLANAIGFDAVDVGPLYNARLLEPLANLVIQLGITQGMGRDVGFRLVR